jgi:hypothetical protein
MLVGIMAVSLPTGIYLLKRPLFGQLLGQQPRSRPSETKRAGIIASLGESGRLEPTLHVTSIVQHGRIVEIQGTTDRGAIVMINGQPAATIFDGNQFRHFVGPLPEGTNIVSITSQNDQGGVNTQQMAVTVQ